MARRRWVWVDGRGLVEVDPDWRPAPRLFHIIGDHHEPFQSMADGKMYDSKSTYRRKLKEQGFEEVACSVESRMKAVEDSLKPKLPPASEDIKAAAETIGFDWSKATPTDVDMSRPVAESSFGWQ